MNGILGAAIDRQLRSRSRSMSFWVGASVPVIVIGALLWETARATQSPATAMFLAILSALWVGGSSCIREVVDERKLVMREPHLSLLAYGIAKMVHASLLAAAQSLIIAIFLIASGVVGLPLSPLWLILFLTTLAGSLLALILSSLCDEAATALAWFPLLLVPQIVFGGFLFPYGETRPFSLDREAGIAVMPPPLIRAAIHEPSLRLAGALCVSRWALEAYAAQVFEQDLSDEDNLQEAIQVAFFIPLTLVERPISDRLLEHVSAPGTAPPALAAASSTYIRLLAMFTAGEAAILILVLPLRDPRRV